MQRVGAKQVCLTPLHGSTASAAHSPRTSDESENLVVRNVVERESHRPDDRPQTVDASSPRTADRRSFSAEQLRGEENYFDACLNFGGEGETAIVGFP